MSEVAKYRATGRSVNGKRPYSIEFEMDPDDPASEAAIRAEFARHVIAKVKGEVGTVLSRRQAVAGPAHREGGKARRMTRFQDRAIGLN